MADADGGGPDRDGLAEDRTKWAEDRTILANERTFASWARTGLASLGVALGFQALFRSVEPTWLAKCGASVFVALAIVIFWAASASARKVLHRLDSHDASPTSRKRLFVVTLAATVGSVALLIALWLF
ncbi:MAG: DUF202 domain-containing protein [Rhizobiaceae bacterium]|nr:DUF202 domain-containing protein [Rhizobiaceae bacterium]MCV0406489.1 DUF202 domain-containing protein [Rhizobiaceae bacterium]